MKSFIAACCIFALVIGLLIGYTVFVRRCTEAMCAAVSRLPENAYGDPAEYETAMRNIHLLWKSSRGVLAVTVPKRITDPLEQALRSLEAGWTTKNDTVYRRSVADLLYALSNLRETEGFSLAAIV